jgi:hypothetical protein
MASKSPRNRKRSEPPTPRPRKARSMMDDTDELPDTDELSDTDELPDTPELAARGARPRVAAARLVESSASGHDLLALAQVHVGEPYVLGSRVPMANSDWHGPWDCAEFASWCVFRVSGTLYGTRPRNDPLLADAYTGYWAEQSAADGRQVSVEQAAAIAGALVLRKPHPSAVGHIVISDGRGGTVEAHSSDRGVIESTLSGRRWDTGILAPGLRYLLSDRSVDLEPPPPVLRLTVPLTAGKSVRALQTRLAELGFPVGSVDGVYGPQTAHAVRLFQASVGIVPDGEVGPQTRRALTSR